MIGIYKITSPSGRIYVGQSRDIEYRWYQHKSLRYDSYGKLVNSLKKYGVENHVFEVIEECEFEDLNIRERYWQDYYEVLGKKGLNSMLTETDEKPRVVSKETKAKIAKGKHGRARKIIDTSNNLIFDCVKDASKYVNISAGNLSHMLNGRALNKTNLVYLNNDGVFSNRLVVVTHIKTKNTFTDNIFTIAKLFNQDVHTIKQVCGSGYKKYKFTNDWVFDFKNAKNKDKKTGFLSITNRSKNIIINKENGFFIYGFTDLALELGFKFNTQQEKVNSIPLIKKMLKETPLLKRYELI